MTRNLYPKTISDPDFPKLEEGVLTFWEQAGTFRASVEQRDGAPEFIFYDGPPFANGLPHYGHLLTSCVKDSVARYQTMRGRKVERRFGWDCHGLPAEMEAEKELQLSGRKAIEDYGIAQFNASCASSVMKYTKEWRYYVTRQARWVDFADDYRTMDKSYMESVMWAFKALYDKGLIYESHRVMPYSWAAETPLSNFETRMDNAYREKESKAVTVAFILRDSAELMQGALSRVCLLLAWTTTPWTLPSNLALGVGEDITYYAHTEGDITTISAQKRADDDIAIKGSDLVGLSYEPMFPYFAGTANAFKILAADFVEAGDGTGIVHLAPGFGEDDQRVCAEHGIPVICPVDDSGRYTQEITDIDYTAKDGSARILRLCGLNVMQERARAEDDPKLKDPFDDKQINKFGLANLRIILYLKQMGILISEEIYKHNYPHCWRTDTPLIYKAVPSWYVEVTKFRDRMVELNQNISWTPSHVRDGLFGKWLEGARDWSISRNRFWGAPIPIWRSTDPHNKKLYVFGSIKELEDFFGREVTDLHRPYIDELTKPDPDSPGHTLVRVPEVLDCWFESGAMPFAQAHYPFENKDWFEKHLPADFIVEYTAQTRGWFYTLMVLSTALFDCEPFKSCICHGVILDENRQKLSKRLRNYPDPQEVYDTIGADALRWMMLSAPVMHGGELQMHREASDIREVVRLVIKPIWNAYHFFCLYANADGVKAQHITQASHKMDRYILSKLSQAVGGVGRAMDAYDMPRACADAASFFEVLTNWYIRRSRERFWSSASEGGQDKQEAYNTLYTVLIDMSRAIAPLLPLVSEAIYLGLTKGADITGEHALQAGDSVHLADFPSMSIGEADIAPMDYVREVCNTALSIRNAENIRIRQPLQRLDIYGNAPDALRDGFYASIICDELNCKEVDFHDDLSQVAALRLQVNLPIAGKRLGSGLRDVMAALKKGDWQREGDIIRIAGQELSPQEYDMLLEAKDGITGAKATAKQDALIVLDTDITPQLKAEGIARDVLRIIQQARKDAGLDITAHININICADDEILRAIADNERFITRQALIDNVEYIDIPEGGNVTRHTLEEGELCFEILTLC